MAARWSKLLLVACIALFFTLVVFNNLTDFGTNYLFVQHVMSMDSTFPGNHGLWRTMTYRWEHLAFYDGIIGWEIVNAAAGWWSAWLLLRAIRRPAAEFERARQPAIAVLTSGMMLWLLAFLTIGGEWFLMWQSRLWNGQEEAFRMFVVEGVALLLLHLREPERYEDRGQ